LEPADRADCELYIDLARTQLEQGTFSEAWDEGGAMTLDRALDFALEGVPSEWTLEPRVTEAPRATPVYPSDLTRRETEVLRLLAQGISNETIAERLFLSHNTVRAHLYSIYSKLNVPSRAAAVRFAFEHNLVQST
jgi:DNA-binding NarL/FixJ family response regulator